MLFVLFSLSTNSLQSYEIILPYSNLARIKNVNTPLKNRLPLSANHKY